MKNCPNIKPDISRPPRMRHITESPLNAFGMQTLKSEQIQVRRLGAQNHLIEARLGTGLAIKGI